MKNKIIFIVSIILFLFSCSSVQTHNPIPSEYSLYKGDLYIKTQKDIGIIRNKYFFLNDVDLEMYIEKENENNNKKFQLFPDPQNYEYKITPAKQYIRPIKRTIITGYTYNEILGKIPVYSTITEGYETKNISEEWNEESYLYISKNDAKKLLEILKVEKNKIYSVRPSIYDETPIIAEEIELTLNYKVALIALIEEYLN